MVFLGNNKSNFKKYLHKRKLICNFRFMISDLTLIFKKNNENIIDNYLIIRVLIT